MESETINVEGGGGLTIGREYDVRHQRKGDFSMRVTAIRGCWIDGTITQGRTAALNPDNARDVGETVSVRASLSHFTPRA